MPRFALPFVCLLLSACGLVASTDDERRMIPAPGIAITPDVPTTLDDLRVEIVEPSVDRSAGVVEYEYSWARGSSEEATGAVLPNALTARDETWTVTVTPVSEGRRGRVARASVTIVNSPPVIASARFGRYDPMRNEAVELYFGPTTDADGDTVTRRIE